MVRDDITWQEVEQHDLTDGSVWTVVDNEVYDISNFYSQHPGGRIIRLCAGKDASALITSHHSNDALKTINAILKNKCQHLGTLQHSEKAVIFDDSFYTTVRQRVEDHLKSVGKTRHWNETAANVELLATVFSYLISTYYTAVYASYFAALILGICLARLGFIMHMGNHGAASGNSTISWLHGITMDLIGSCSLVWMHEHQVAHHITPNEFGKDNDCHIGDPYIRMHPALPPPKWWHRFQPIITILGICGGFFKWYVGDPFCVAAGEVGHIKFYRDNKDFVRLFFWKLQWAIMHLFIPLYFHGVSWDVFGPFILFMVIGANYLEQIFVVNHIQDGLIPPVNCHWSHKQVLGSSNWSSGGKLTNFLSGGLNHQIEHHLFPSISYYLYPEIAPIVRQTCKEYGLKYRNFDSFPQAWLQFMKYLTVLGTQTHID